MTSNTEKGRRFQEACKVALEQALGCCFETEVRISAPGLKTHKFDLATPRRDILVECKAFTWTRGGNVPSAKITHLREAVGHLRQMPGARTLYLVIKKGLHPKRGETLAAYFVKLNKEILGQVTVLELTESGGELNCVYGTMASQQRPGGSSVDTPSDVHRAITVGELGEIRRGLLRILDWREGCRSREEGLAKRVTRLRSAGKIPHNVANLMQTLRLQELGRVRGILTH
jgi:hypothetical protein